MFPSVTEELLSAVGALDVLDMLVELLLPIAGVSSLPLGCTTGVSDGVA